MKPAPRLYACLYVPDFAAAALLRREYRQRPPAAAVHQGKRPNLFVVAATAPARATGIAEGMPVEEAKARYEAASVTEPLRWFDRDPGEERAAQLELLDLALTISPLVEDTAPGRVTLDLTGLPDPYQSAQRLSLGAERTGLPANVAVACQPFIAHCAARTRAGLTHIFPGQEPGFLNVLPANELPLEAKERETLARWGIRTTGQLAALPASSLVARFGPRGAELARLARGITSAAFRPYQPNAPYEASLDLDWEVGEMEPLAFLMAGLLDTLCLELRAHDQAAAALHISLKLAGGGRFERIVPLSYPLADPQVLLTLVRLDLESHPPGDAVIGMTLGAQAAPQRMVQYSLFEPALPSPEKLAVTLARLHNLLGKDHAGSPVVVDTHRPGAFALAVFAPTDQPRSKKLPPEAPPRPVMPFRHFRPVRQAEVLVEVTTPVHVRSSEVSGSIDKRSGPWRVCGEWWTESAWSFEEWDVGVRGRLYRIACNLSTRDWHLAGVYD